MNQHVPVPQLISSPVRAAGDTMDLECPACGDATAHRFLYRKAGCDIFKCEGCGLGRTETTGFDPASYYTSDYFDGGHDDGYGDYLGAEPVLRREFAAAVEFIRKHKPGGRMLEIGCAYGFFLAEARRHFDVTGIEIADDAAAFARSRGLNVVAGMADGPTLAGLGAFDVIVMLDVIEHLPDPLATLDLCAKHLNSGGIIMMTTGDFGSWPARITGAQWRLMTPPQHLWFHTRESMAGLARSTGLTLESFDHPWKQVPLSLIAFQVGRMVGVKLNGASGVSRIGLPVNLFDAMRVVLRKASHE